MRISIGDARLFFDVEGESLRADGPRMRQFPTLLLLHGGPLIDHSMFKPEYSRLCEVAQLVFLDHRGCGRSDKSTSAHWNLAQWATDVRDFCDALEIRKPIVLGVSFGGIVAMKYATMFPNHPGQLVLCSTAPKFRLDRVLEAFERLGGSEAREAAKRFWEEPTPDNRAEYQLVCAPLLIAATQTRPLNLTVEKATELANSWTRTTTNRDVSEFYVSGEHRRFDFSRELHRIESPTLVLSGGLDPLTTPNDAADIIAGIRKELVTQEQFPQAGHGIVFDTPEAYFAAIRKFVTGAHARG
jgi:pimeloyl-ACP methyl ester carboxylesterase